jgi:hypothetical protein
MVRGWPEKPAGVAQNCIIYDNEKACRCLVYDNRVAEWLCYRLGLDVQVGDQWNLTLFL